MAELDLNGINKYVNQVITNTRSNLIEITEDKLENILLKHQKKVFNATIWVTPFAIFLTILIVLLTSTFKDFLSINKNIWQAIFIVAFIGSIVWTGISIYRAVNNKSQSSIKFLIEQIKNTPVNT